MLSRHDMKDWSSVTLIITRSVLLEVQRGTENNNNLIHCYHTLFMKVETETFSMPFRPIWIT